MIVCENDIDKFVEIGSFDGYGSVNKSDSFSAFLSKWKFGVLAKKTKT